MTTQTSELVIPAARSQSYNGDPTAFTQSERSNPALQTRKASRQEDHHEGCVATDFQALIDQIYADYWSI